MRLFRSTSKRRDAVRMMIRHGVDQIRAVFARIHAAWPFGRPGRRTRSQPGRSLSTGTAVRCCDNGVCSGSTVRVHAWRLGALKIAAERLSDAIGAACADETSAAATTKTQGNAALRMGPSIRLVGRLRGSSGVCEACGRLLRSTA